VITDTKQENENLKKQLATKENEIAKLNKDQKTKDEVKDIKDKKDIKDVKDTKDANTEMKNNLINKDID